MDKNVAIEIIPWRHGFDYNIHESVIQFIKSLPRNSTLALEISEKQLMEFTGNSKKSLENATNIKSPTQKSIRLAFFEVIHECRKKNIQIIPVESNTLFESATNLFSRGGKVDPVKLMKNSVARENAFARAIKTHLSAFKGKLFVLTGEGHVVGIQQGLMDLRINSRININIFGSDRTSIEKTMESYREARTAFLKPDAALVASKLHEADSFAAQYLQRRESSDVLINRMFLEIEKREEAARKRLLKKTMAHKQESLRFSSRRSMSVK